MTFGKLQRGIVHGGPHIGVVCLVHGGHLVDEREHLLGVVLIGNVVASGILVPVHDFHVAGGDERDERHPAPAGNAVVIIHRPLAVSVILRNGGCQREQLIHRPLFVVDQCVGVFQTVVLQHILIEDHAVRAGEAEVAVAQQVPVIDLQAFHQVAVPVGRIQIDGGQVGEVHQTVGGDKIGDALVDVREHQLVGIVAGLHRVCDFAGVGYPVPCVCKFAFHAQLLLDKHAALVHGFV